MFESLLSEPNFEVNFPLRCIQTVYMPPGLSLAGWLLAKHNSTALLCRLQSLCSKEENRYVLFIYLLLFLRILNDRNSIKAFEHFLALSPAYLAYGCFLPQGLFTHLPRLFPLRKTKTSF